MDQPNAVTIDKCGDGLEYDYVIVGAGSSGCAVAAELARDGRYTVALLEAGGRNRHPFIEMPRGYAALWTDPKYFWKFPVKPQPGRPSGEVWYYGKGLGGSSAVNGAWYFRGQPADYDSWEAAGNAGWNWRTFEAAYQRVESFTEPHADSSRGQHGPISVSTVKWRSALTEAAIAAGRESGLDVLDDVNTPRRSGVGYTQMSVDRTGRRVSSWRGFLGKCRATELATFSGALVERISFEGKRATGVIGQYHGKPVAWRARKCLVLSAGVLQSPKLLQLSGIGDPDLLARHGIEVVHPLPHVGRNMSEHMMLELGFRLKGAPGMNREFRGWRLYRNVTQYYLTRKGPMAYGLPEVSAMLSSTGDTSWPNIQLGFSPATFEPPAEGTNEPGRGKTERAPGLSVVAFFLRPKARGSVAIQSASILDPVLIDANWLAEPDDATVAIDMVKIVRRYVSQPALAKYVVGELAPTAAAQSDEEIGALLPSILRSGLHGTGTCRMGDDPATSVVDRWGRAHDVPNLFIVDGSLMVTSAAVNPTSTIQALALRTADYIKQARG